MTVAVAAAAAAAAAAAVVVPLIIHASVHTSLTASNRLPAAD